MVAYTVVNGGLPGAGAQRGENPSDAGVAAAADVAVRVGALQTRVEILGVW
jgi:hypothetical protein